MATESLVVIHKGQAIWKLQNTSLNFLFHFVLKLNIGSTIAYSTQYFLYRGHHMYENSIANTGLNRKKVPVYK